MRLFAGIAHQAKLAIQNAGAFDNLEETFFTTVEALANALEANDEYTSSHARWITDMALDVGRELGLDAAALKRLELGALFHDIGKIGIPSTILLKPGPLTQQERAVMETHPELGERILAPIARLEDVRPIVRHCHERWDGRGYPDALGGRDIPIESRVIFVCDAFHAMTTDRPYRRAMLLRGRLQGARGRRRLAVRPRRRRRVPARSPRPRSRRTRLVRSGFTISGVSEPLNAWDFERLAEAKVEAGPWGYFVGGAGDERTLAENLAAFRRWHLRPRMLVDVASVTTTTTVLGGEISMPILVAPTAFQYLAHPGRRPRHGPRRSGQAGTVMCLSTLGGASAAQLAEAAPGGGSGSSSTGRATAASPQSLIEAAADAGFEAIVLTVDLPAAGRRERDIRAAFEIPTDLPLPNLSDHLGRGDFHATLSEVVDPSVTWRDLEWLRSVSPLPLLVKGILTEEDAQPRLRARCRRRRRLESRRPPARRRAGEPRCPSGGRGGGRRALPRPHGRRRAPGNGRRHGARAGRQGGAGRQARPLGTRRRRRRRRPRRARAPARGGRARPAPPRLRDRRTPSRARTWGETRPRSAQRDARRRRFDCGSMKIE